MTDVMQLITQLTNQGFFDTWTDQESSIRRERVQGTKECETFNATWLMVLPARHP